MRGKGAYPIQLERRKGGDFLIFPTSPFPHMEKKKKEMHGRAFLFLLSGNRAFGRWIKKFLFSSVWEFEGKRRELEKNVEKKSAFLEVDGLFFSGKPLPVFLFFFSPFRNCGFFLFLFLEKFRYFPLFLALPEEESSLPGRRRQKNQKLWTTVVLPHTRKKGRKEISHGLTHISVSHINFQSQKIGERDYYFLSRKRESDMCFLSVGWMAFVCM